MVSQKIGFRLFAARWVRAVFRFLFCENLRIVEDDDYCEVKDETFDGIKKDWIQRTFQKLM
jgi:hypothetical protein